jgi:phosphohistidine phosphatase
VQQDSRRLVVVRHAKAEQSGESDHARRLIPRGRKDAESAGRWLAGEGVVPDHALVSAAPRARETWESLAAGAGWSVEPDLDEGLYSAEPDTALDLIRRTPPDAAVVVVVGHNPTMGQLVQLLDDGEGDPAASNAMVRGFPTSAVAVFEYDGVWADLDITSARLVACHVGRDQPPTGSEAPG